MRRSSHGNAERVTPMPNTMTTDQLRKLFKPFCAKETGRYMINDPWVKDGYLIATNGRICVRIPVADADSPPVTEPYPPMQDLPWKSEYEDPIEIPEIPELAKEQCMACNGHGVHSCPDCDHRHECGNCKGTGEVAKEVQAKPIAIGNVCFYVDRLRLVKAIGATHLRLATGHRLSPALFNFLENGEGLILPCEEYNR